MKKHNRKLKLSADSIRILADLSNVVGGDVTHSKGCPSMTGPECDPPK